MFGTVGCWDATRGGLVMAPNNDTNHPSLFGFVLVGGTMWFLHDQGSIVDNCNGYQCDEYDYNYYH